jgi:hypothetical protein
MSMKWASVKVMNSYDYGHFEITVGVESDKEISLEEIDNARKEAQRLVDKAIKQYKVAKEMASKRTDGEYQKVTFEAECKKILNKQEGDRTINEIAMIKQYQDENWEEKFKYYYDYEDEDIEC